MHRAVLRNLVLGVVVALATGCSGGAILSGHGSVGQLGARPGLPRPAKQHTAAGAVALASYYIEAITPALRTGDWHVLRQLADPNCDGCADFVRAIQIGLVSLDNVTDLRLVVDSAALVRNREFPAAEYGVDVSFHDDVDISLPGQRVDTLPGAEELDVHVWVAWRRTGWTVVALTSET